MSLTRRLARTVVATVVALASLVAAVAIPSHTHAATTGDACRSEPTAGTVDRRLAQRSYRLHVPADIRATWCVDPHRVYAEGYSNGAMMVERLACDAADLFAGVAAYAGASPAFDTPCATSRPVAVGIFQSLFDPISSYPIGVHNRDEWVTRNGCPTTPATESGVLFEAARYARHRGRGGLAGVRPPVAQLADGP